MTREMKNSGVPWIGKIPENWHVNALKRIAQIQTGSTPSKKEGNNYYSDEDGIPWIKPENLDSSFPIINTSEYLNDSGAKMGRIFQPHTTFVACIASIGKTGYSDVVCSCNQQINGITFNNSMFWKYGYYALTASAVEHIAKSNVSVQAILNSQQEGYIKLPIPSYDEQVSIANYVDVKSEQLLDAISRHQSIIEKLEEYKKSIITQAVTNGLNPDVEMKDSGIGWIGEIPQCWDVIKLKFVTTVRNEKGNFNPIKDKYIGLENIEGFTGRYIETETQYAEAEYCICKKGDVAFCKLRPYLTKSLEIPFDGFCTNELIIYNSFRGNMKYLLYILLNDKFVDVVNGSTYGAKMPRANPEFIRNIEIPFPPIHEQNIIIEYLSSKCSQIDEAISRQKAAIEKLEEYRKSLIYNAVTGKIDCREATYEKA